MRLKLALKAIILLIETLLSAKIPNSIVRETVGDGVCIFVMDEVAGHRIHPKITVNCSTTNPVESILLEISINMVQFLIGCIY